MGNSIYYEQLEKAAARIDKKILRQKGIELAVVNYKDSVVLKLYKRQWATPGQDPLTAGSRIFFSIWTSDSGGEVEKLLYNIHALKLRKLKAFSIQSRKFAETFRIKFKEFEHQWPNVSVDYGPLTLMEGWVKIKPDHFHQEAWKLASQFLEIEYLVDETLEFFK